ncbi:hypothetical protein MKMG_00139 [Methanogenium sp. MK-MG]|nr:hypothetical protein MKMG_00139 [Methanogenium sp. MK-MG]
MNEIKESKKIKTEIETKTERKPETKAKTVTKIRTDRQPADAKQPADAETIDGSPTTKPCANSVSNGTANEQSAADSINATVDAVDAVATVSAAHAVSTVGAADAAGAVGGGKPISGRKQIPNGKPNPNGRQITAGSVPLYLIPQAVSREVHTHKGRISEIVIRRTGRHDYAITLTTLAALSPRGGPSPKAGHSPRGEPHAD